MIQLTPAECLSAFGQLDYRTTNGPPEQEAERSADQEKENHDQRGGRTIDLWLQGRRVIQSDRGVNGQENDPGQHKNQPQYQLCSDFTLQGVIPGYVYWRGLVFFP